MRNRQDKQQRVQMTDFEAKRLSHGAKGLAHGVIPSNAPTLDKARSLVISTHLICNSANYISKHVRNPVDVDGRVQDTLLEALQAYSELKDDSTLKSRLIGIDKHQIDEGRADLGDSKK